MICFGSAKAQTIAGRIEYFNNVATPESSGNPRDTDGQQAYGAARGQLGCGSRIDRNGAANEPIGMSETALTGLKHFGGRPE